MVIWPAWSNTTRSTDVKIINLRAYDKIYKKREKKKKSSFHPIFVPFLFQQLALWNKLSLKEILPALIQNWTQTYRCILQLM